MVKVSIDEGYAYDLLSIAAVKVAKKAADPIHIANHHRLERELIEQVTATVHCDILISEEYCALYHANLALFNHIDDMKSRAPRLEDGRLTDQHNYQRYTHKAAIQRRFFGTEMAERKIGYDGHRPSTS